MHDLMAMIYNYNYMDADGVTLKQITIKVTVKISSWGEIQLLQRTRSQSNL